MRYPFFLAAGLVGGAAASWAVASNPTFSLDAHVISAGTPVHSASACYRLEAVIGEPVAGYSHSATYSMDAGLLDAQPGPFDSLFADSFEDCPP